MTKQSDQSPPTWALDVWAWFEKELAREDLSANERAILRRLKTDSRMGTVAEKLEREEEKPHSYIPDRSIRFIRYAWESPKFYREHKDNRRYRAEGIHALAKACDAAAKTLGSQRELATYWILLISGRPEGIGVDSPMQLLNEHPEYFEHAAAKLADLISTLQYITQEAEASYKGFNRQIVHDIPRKTKNKKNADSPEEVSCMKRVLENTWEYFSEPLCTAIATTLTVVLQRPITSGRVNSIWADMKKADPILELSTALQKDKRRGGALGIWPNEADESNKARLEERYQKSIGRTLFPMASRTLANRSKARKK